MLPARGGQLQDSVGLVCNAHRSPRVVVSFPAHRQRWQAPSGAHTLFAPRAPWLADLRNASSCRLLPALSGWDERFDPSALSELKRFAPEVDFVLLSHPDLAHVGALPYDVPHSAHCASICMLHRGLASARMSPAPAHNCPTALRLLTFGSKAQLEEH